MTKRKANRSKPKVSDLLLFGPAPLLYSEHPAVYDDLLAQVSEAVSPLDTLERIWVRDIVDLSWEILRLRRIKVTVINLAVWDELVDTLNALADSDDETPEGAAQADATEEAAAAEEVDETDAQGPEDEETDDSYLTVAELVDGWIKREPAMVQQVDSILAAGNLSIDAVIAETFFLYTDRVDLVERIDRMIATAEARRNATVREIDRHRAMFGGEPRLVQIEDDSGDPAAKLPNPAKS